MDNNQHVYGFELTRVINGDTVEGTVDLGFGIATKQRFRLKGVVAPSMRTRDKAELEKAVAAKLWLQFRLVDKSIVIQCHSTNKFGKYLAVLFVDGSNVNDELLVSGHVVKFGKPDIEEDENDAIDP